MSVVRCQLPCFLGNLLRSVVFQQWSRVKLSQRQVSGENVRIELQALFIARGRLGGFPLFFVSGGEPVQDNRIVRLSLQKRLQFGDRELCFAARGLFQQSKPTLGLALIWEIGGGVKGLFKSRASLVRLTHHIAGHAEMKLDPRSFREFIGAFLKERQGLLVIATLVKDPPERIGDLSRIWFQSARFLCQFVGSVELV